MNLPLIGGSALVHDALARARRAAPFPYPILLTGETGTGKSTLARFIHDAGDGGRPFVGSGVPALGTLPLGTLAGHDRGAFTGAIANHRGLVEQAHGGSLFLDDINTATLEVQQLLLELVETGQVRRLGGERSVAVRVRLITASNEPLEGLVARGAFKLDLYHRLSALPIHLPPLRQHPDDVPLIAAAVLSELAPLHGPRTLDPAAVQRLKTHTWPGNVRELRNVLTRAVVFGGRERITPDDLELSSASCGRRLDLPGSAEERGALALALRRELGSYNRVAEHLDVDLRTVHRWISAARKTHHRMTARPEDDPA